MSLSAGLKCGDGSTRMMFVFRLNVTQECFSLLKGSVPPCALTNTLNVPSLFSAVNRRTSGLR